MQIELYSYIMQDKFGGPAKDYIQKTARNLIAKIVKFFTSKELNPAPGTKRPDENSSFDDQILYALEKIDARFGAGIVMKVDAALKREAVIAKASSASGLPSIYIYGKSYFNFSFHETKGQLISKQNCRARGVSLIKMNSYISRSLFL